MADHTKIEWSDATWSPTLGCSNVSPGCDNCYAIKTVHRLSFNPNPKIEAAAEGLTAYRPGVGPVWTGAVRTLPERLDIPLRWRKPRRIFVDSQSDLFHDRISDGFIAQVWAIMAATPQHTYQVLTKRHARMRSLLGAPWFPELVTTWAWRLGVRPSTPLVELPARNVWVGVSVEDQKWADIRIPALLDTPAAVRFLSCEPLLGPVDLSAWTTWPDGSMRYTEPPNVAGIDWVIAGGESGPGARPMHPEWARSLRDQCTAAGVPFHFKQWGEFIPNPSMVEEDMGFRVVLVEHGQGDELNRYMWRVGKKRAGRELDGRTWDEFPEPHRDEVAQ